MAQANWSMFCCDFKGRPCDPVMVLPNFRIEVYKSVFSVDFGHDKMMVRSGDIKLDSVEIEVTPFDSPEGLFFCACEELGDVDDWGIMGVACYGFDGSVRTGVSPKLFADFQEFLSESYMDPDIPVKAYQKFNDKGESE